jgi:hypothetical protein
MVGSLENASILHLLIELLKDGKAEIPELAPLEPINLDQVVATLRRKAGVDLGRDFESWYRWFTQDYNDAALHERETLRLIKEMVEQRRTFKERFDKRRG